MTSIPPLDFSRLAEHLHPAPLRERLRSKAIQALLEYFIIRAATSPVTGLGSESEPQALAWLRPGVYPLGELQERFAPRFTNNRKAVGSESQIIAVTVQDVIASEIKTLIVLPEQDSLRERAQAQGLTEITLQQAAVAAVGRTPGRRLIHEITTAFVRLEAADICAAGKRRSLAEVISRQEQHQSQRSQQALTAHYLKLRGQWHNFFGEASTGHIAPSSAAAKSLVLWLLTLSPEDASLFLSGHHASARMVANLGLPAKFLDALNNAISPVAPSLPSAVYGKLHQLLGTIMDIKGLRRVTISTHTDDFIRIDIDPCNRIGAQEAHLPHFVQLLLTGLVSSAGVMVRAYQDESINIFVPEEGKFKARTVKHLQGALLESGAYHGLTSAQVYGAHTHSTLDGSLVAREPSMRCLDWPTADAPQDAPPAVASQ